MNIRAYPSCSAFVKLAFAACAAVCLLAGHVQAATYTWTGATSSTVDDIGNWNGLAASFGTLDTAYWNGNQAGPLILSLTGNAVMNPAAPGINLLVDSGQVSALTLNSSNGTATMRLNGIILNPGAGAFTLGSASLATTTNITLGGSGAAPNTIVNLINNSGNTATVGANVFFNNSATATHVLALNGSSAWSFNAPIQPHNGGQIWLADQGTGVVTYAGTTNGAAVVEVGASAAGNSTSTFNIVPGAFLAMSGGSTSGGPPGTLNLGMGSLGTGILNQSGGTVSLTTAGWNLELGEVGGSYGYYNMTGGSLFANEIEVGNNGTGYYNQSGGTVTAANWFLLARSGTGGSAYGIANITGGQLLFNGGNNFVDTWTGQGSSVNVSGGGFVSLGGNNVLLGGPGVGGVLNVNSGGTLQVSAIKYNNGTGGFNLNGGLIIASSATTSFISNNANIPTHVFANGGTISNNGNNITIPAALLAPSGSGVLSIAVTGSGYSAPPAVMISGGGTGATGVATIDSSGNLTGITITAPGFNYSSPPTLTLIGGGGTLSSFSVSMGTFASGAMTFRGGGVTTLTNISTYIGGTTVNGGTLALGAGGASGAVRGLLNITSGGAVNLTTGDALGFGNGTSVTTVSISGGLLNNATATNNSYITNYTLTGGSMTSSGGGSYNFSTGNSVTTNASNLTSVISGPIIIRDANNLTFNVAAGTTPSGVDLLSTGVIANGPTGADTVNSITKTGAGQMVIGSPSSNGTVDTYTGSTTVANGSLLLSAGTLLGTGVVSVSGGAAFGGNGSAGLVTIASGGTLQGGLGSGGGSLVVPSLTYLGGGGMFLSAVGSNNTTTPNVNVTGTLTTANPIPIQIGSLAGATTGTVYQLLNYGSIAGTGTSVFNLSMPLPNRAIGSLSFPAGQVDLTLTAIDFLHWSGSQSTAWDTTSANWTLNSNGGTTTYIDSPAGDTVVFDDKTSNGTVSIASAVHPSSVTFSNTATSYILQGAGGIYGATGLTFNGPGSLTINTSNGYSGVTQIHGGLVQTGSASALGAGALVVNGGTLNLGAALNNSSGTLDNAQLYTNGSAVITNTVPFTINPNGGTIGVVSGNQLYFHTANTLLGSGPLTLTGTGALGSTSGVGNLRIDQTNSYSGNVTIQNGGIFEFGANNAVSSSATFTLGNQGEITVPAGVGVPNNITVGAPSGGGTNSVLGFEQFGGGLSGTYSGVINLNANANVALQNWYNASVTTGLMVAQVTGSGGLAINSGSGTGGVLALGNSTSDYTGGTSVSNAILLVGAVQNQGTASGSTTIYTAMASLGAGTLTVNSGGAAQFGYHEANTDLATIPQPIVLNGGALWANDAYQHLAGDVNVTAAGGTLGSTYEGQTGSYGWNKGLFLDGIVSGSGSLTLIQAGAGGEVNGYGNGAGNAFNTSIVMFTNPANSYSGVITVTGGTTGLNSYLGVNASTALQYATVNVVGNNTGTNQRWGSRALLFQTQMVNATLGALEGSGNVALTGYNEPTATAATDPIALSVGNNNAATTYSGVMSGNGSLTKIGSGTFTLTGSNTYIGGTTIDGGVLNINADAALGATSGSLGFTNNTGAPVLQFGADGISLSANRNIVINSGVTATFDTQGFSATVLGPVGESNPTGSLQKLGAGSLTLANTNGYTGATTIGGGTLTIGAAGNLGASNYPGNIAIAAGAVFNYTSSLSQSLGGVISGSGALTLNGPGVLALNNANTYTGNTAINAGTLLVNGNFGGSLGATNVSVAAGGVLAAAGSASIGGNVSTLAAGATINLQNAGIDTLGVHNLALASGSVLNFDIGGTPGTNDQIAVSGSVSLTPNAGGTVNLLQPNIAAGNYTLLTSAAGGLTPGGADFTLGTHPFFHGSENFNQSTSTALVLTVSANPFQSTVYFTGAASIASGDAAYNWSAGTSNTNWSTDPAGLSDAGQVPGPITSVFFTASNAVPNVGGSVLSSQLDANYSIQGLTFEVPATSPQITVAVVKPNGHTLSLGGAPSGSGLTLAADSSASATIAGGSVQLTTSQSWANNSGLPLTVNAAVAGVGPTTLTFNGTGTGGIALNGALSNGGGPLALVFNQAGVTQLNVANAFTGGVTISSGTVQLGDPGSLNAATPNAVTFGSGSFAVGDLQVNGNAVTVSSLNSDSSVQAIVENGPNAGGSGTLTVANATASTYGGALQDGSGLGGPGLTLVKTGSAALYLTGMGTYTGGTNINAGVLNFASGALPLGGIAFGGGTLQWAGGNLQDVSPGIVPIAAGQAAILDPNSQGISFASALTGSGGLTLVGSGSLTLLASNSYTGTTTVSGGTLQVDVGGSTGTPGAGNIVNNSVLIFDRSDSYTLNNNISGAGSLFQIGNGTLTLAGTNSGLGLVTVTNSGALSIAGSTSVAAGTITVGANTGNASVLNILPGSTLNASVAFPSIIAGAATGASGTINMTGGALNTTSELWLSSAGSATGTMNMSGGTANIGSWLAVGRGGDGGVLNVSGGSINVATNNLTIASFAGNAGTLNVSGGTVHTVNAIYDGEGGVGAMTVSGSGVVTVTSLFVGLNNGASGSYVQTGGLLSANGTTFNAANGVGFVVGSVAGAAGTMDVSGGTLTGGGPLMVWGGTGAITISQTGAAPTLVNPAWITLGQLAGAVGTITQNSGTVVTNNDNFYIGWGAGAQGFYNMHGGSMTVNDFRTDTGTATVYQDGGLVTVNAWLRMGLGGTASTTYTLAGGTLNIAGGNVAAPTADNAYIGENGMGIMTIGGSNGGTMIVSPTSVLTVALGATSSGTLNLQPGGLLRTPDVAQGSGAAAFNFSGGTLEDAVSGNLTVSMPVNLSGPGTVVLDNSQSGTFTALAPISGDGSLTKDGGGVLTLTGTNTYSGGTNVFNGTLLVTTPQAIEDGTSLYVGAAGSIFAPVVPAPQAAETGVAPVPEPGSLLLFAAGSVAALTYRCGRRWKRKRG